ncbi:MAG: glycosyltransferase family 4 protein [Leptolyngbyaceae cyanobacterium bins.349]|nr:glycosyltransferase family 4 protein [Leptolyngbyaceae cyanobacterium bins.349]
MRILHLLNDVEELGNGIINVAVDLACSQVKAGHAVWVASGGGSYELLLGEYGVQHVLLRQSRQPLTLMQAAIDYPGLIRRVQPDIVHAHMMTGVVLATVMRFAGSYKLVATVHNEFQRSAILMGLADRVIAVSQAVADAMMRRGIAPQKLRVVRNGPLHTPRLRRSQSPMPLHRPAITTVAGLRDRKGIAELITAFEHIAAVIPMAHLYLVGDGPDRAKYEQQASASPYRDRIHFAGFQPDPMRYLHSSDVFVLASRQEPFGLVLAEAREAGCAIVATQVDGIPEALDQGQAGILVPPGDVPAIATALHTLLTQPEQLRHWQQCAQQNLGWLSVERVNRETLAVYGEVTLAKPAAVYSLLRSLFPQTSE